ncbi:hypothetical protein M885DRAFT_514406 [Pelagophyceae sp. CCMP2097]|nr:hypothetical protein M885DRAFT_514406 [Pelagophyceae sp. CCMP2097]
MVDEQLCQCAFDRLVEFISDPVADAARAGTYGTLPARLARRGEWGGAIAESVVDGEMEPEEIISALLVCDGRADRQDRRHVLSLNFRLVGIASATYGRGDGTLGHATAITYTAAFRAHPPTYAAAFEQGSPAFLGMQLENLKILGGPASGKFVANVKALAPGGQAEAAGIVVGSRLLEVNKACVGDYEHAMAAIDAAARPLHLIFAHEDAVS